MKNENSNKIALSAFVIVLLLSMPTIIAGTAAPALAASSTVQTASYLSAQPNPAGIGQQVVIAIWIVPLAPLATDLTHGVTVTITRPDGTSQVYPQQNYSGGRIRLCSLHPNPSRHAQNTGNLHRRTLHKQKPNLLSKPKPSIQPNSPSTTNSNIPGCTRSNWILDTTYQRTI